MGQALHGCIRATEAAIVAFRNYALPPLDDGLYSPQARSAKVGLAAGHQPRFFAAKSQSTR
ncbi:MAG: hypothetical protein LBJ59_01500 [Zoogloeaceae bacterium]|jgi:hypothetical protein|nr:hypothetical protein [Zoogloeaceae bacterium]